MNNRGCYQDIGPFAHPRGFLSEIILPPPQGRNSDRPFHDSWSDSCLERVLHQLWECRTPRGGYGCGGPHDYFRDILGKVTGLDYEFNKLEHFLSNRQRVSTTKIGDGKTTAISANDMSYLDFAAKSLLELICGLKRELTVQVKIGRGDRRFRAVRQTNKLVSVLENKLNDLLGKLDEFKIGNVENLCCERCSEHTPTVARPPRSKLSCPWKKNMCNLPNQDQSVRNVSLDFLHNSKVPVSLVKYCRANKTGFKHRKMHAMQPKCRSVNNTPNQNIFINTSAKKPPDSGQWVTSGFARSKTDQHLQNTFSVVCGRSNNRMAEKICPNSMKSKNLLNYNCGVQNKNNDVVRSVPRYEISGLVNATSRSAAYSQRKRAGEDGRAINGTSDYRPESHNNNRRLVNGNKKQQSYNEIPQPSDQTRMWSKRVSFHSTSSDITTTSDNGSDSPVVTLTDYKNSQNRSRKNLNRSRNKRPDEIGRDFSYTNRTQRTNTNKEDQKAAKNNNIQLKGDADSLSSDETISIKHKYISAGPNANTKSHIASSKGYPKNKRFIQVNKPYAPINRTNKKPKLRRRSKQIYRSKRKQKPNSTSVYPSKPRRDQKQRPQPNRSKVGNFLKRVGNKLSKIRIYSSKPRKNISKSGSSKSSVRKLPSEKSLKGYKRIPKRKEIEFTNSSYPSRTRIRSFTTMRKANSIDSGKYDVYSISSSLTELTYSDDSHSASSVDETNSVSLDYPYFFERVPSTYEYDSGCSIVPEDGCQPVSPDIPISPQPCDVCPPHMGPAVCNLPPSELSDEYEIIFEKLEDPIVKYDSPKKVVRKILIEKSKSTSTLSTESSPSSETVSSSIPENEINHQHRKYVRRIVSKNVSVSLPEYKIVHRPRTYFRRISEREKVSSFLPEHRTVHQPRKYSYIRRLSEMDNVSSFVPEYKTIHQPRKYVWRNRFRNWATIKKRTSPPGHSEEEVHRYRNKRRRKYIRIGSEKFQEITENVIRYDESYQPPERQNSPPIIKMTFSRGTSTELFQPSEERFTYQPPVKDTYSRGTSTEVLPLHAKRTSTSDLIKLIKAIGTNTEQLITRDTGIDPMPLKQKTPPTVIDVKTKFTNTDRINVHSAGTETIPESPKPPLINRATDPLFYTDHKDKTTNTAPEQKKDVMTVGTDPRPMQKLQLATKATDPLYYLGQQVKFTNTEAAIKADAQTETPKGPTNASIGTATTPVRVQDQKTSFEKVKTSSRGNNPIAVHMSDKGFQFDTVEHKPVVKTAFTETFTNPRIGKATQTSFTEKPKVVPSVYAVQTQTEKPRRKPAPQKLKQRKPSLLSEEVAVVESSIASPSELSMHLVFEKCQEDIYKRRTNICKPRCCERKQRVVVHDNVTSSQTILSSSSDCNVSSVMQKDPSPLELASRKTKDPLPSNFTSDNDLQTVGKTQNSARIRKPKLGEECGIIDNKSQMNKQNPTTSIENLHTESDGKSTRKFEASAYDSSYTTLTSCDWVNIAKEVKLNN